jgi:class 3 adenylate cyclase
MGVHVGQPRMLRDPKTRRTEYIGPVVNATARITAITHGGQVPPMPLSLVHSSPQRTA